VVSLEEGASTDKEEEEDGKRTEAQVHRREDAFGKPPSKKLAFLWGPRAGSSNRGEKKKHENKGLNFLGRKKGVRRTRSPRKKRKRPFIKEGEGKGTKRRTYVNYQSKETYHDRLTKETTVK